MLGNLGQPVTILARITTGAEEPANQLKGHPCAHLVQRVAHSEK